MVPPSPSLGGGGGAVYRLEVSVSRLELATHPLQCYEDWLAARLMASYREWKRREAAGLAAFYADKARALQESVVARWRNRAERTGREKERRERERERARYGPGASALDGARAAIITRGGGGHAPRRDTDYDDGVDGDKEEGEEGGDDAADGPSGPGAVEAEALRALEEEAAEARALADAEAEASRDAVATMRAVYAALLGAREAQGFCTTALGLEVVPASGGPTSDAEERERAELEVAFDVAAAEVRRMGAF